MNKILLIVLMIVISSCCTTTQTSPCSQPIQEIYKPTALEKQKADEKAAWEYAENNELVTAIEQSDVQKWVIDLNRQVVLSEKYDLMINLRFSKIYSRMSIFSDGSLYLDGEKKELVSEHTKRLRDFYYRVILVQKK